MAPQYLEALNPQQLEAVTLPHESALILAGAGSGKTRVLTTRIAWLIETRQVSPLGLLAVTFTNKAAREMLARISAMLPINTRGMWVGTFHGLCNRMLRAHHRDAGLPQQFQILDSQDQLGLIKRLLKTLNVDDEKFPPRQLQWFINAAKEDGRRARDVAIYDDVTRRSTELYAAYDEQCQREGVVDFAELLLRCYELLSRNEILREHYRERFRHLLVDEFQDTNALQYRWLKLLAGRGPSPASGAAPDSCAVFAVGDDDQSIYAFRGANAANMHEFERDFAVRRVIKLEQNYRSHGRILDAANALIRNNSRRLGKNLWTAEGKGEPLRVYEAGSDGEEAQFIVDEVKALAADGLALAEIALLYRSNAQSRVLEHALFAAGLPYRVYGGLRFFERQEIKHALAYLRLLANPDEDSALLRVINFPARGIGNRSIEQLQDAATAAGGSLWAAAKERAGGGKSKDEGKAQPEASFSSLIPHPSSLKGVPAFVALVESMRAACAGLPLAETVEHVLEHSGLKAFYQSERDGADRLENLDELVNAATVFSADDALDDRGLAAFLAHASLEAGEHQAQAGADALQLMTAHSAKGLEFHSVFISGLEEGLFPHENSLTEVDGIDEERRLMYVALTRARRRLYLTLAQSRLLHGQTRYNIASRFLREIPAELMKRVHVARFDSWRTRDASAAGNAAGASTYARPNGRTPASGEARAPYDLPAASPWRIGQNVVHPKFGSGVIVNAEGRGADARVQVNFDAAGVKWLALEYAKLTRA